MSARRLASVLALLPLLGTSGCCTLARLFCGPDDSEWVSVGYATPRQTLATFLEAIRRDNPTQVYFCLSPAFVAEHGLDGLAFHVAWQRLQDETPGLHLAGYAEVPERPTRAQDRGVTYELDVHGRRLRVDLVAQNYWTVRYRDADGLARETGQILDGSLNGVLEVEDAGRDPDGEAYTRIDLDEPIRFYSGSAAVPLERVDSLGVGREWKISGLVMPEQ